MISSFVDKLIGSVNAGIERLVLFQTQAHYLPDSYRNDSPAQQQEQTRVRINLETWQLNPIFAAQFPGMKSMPSLAELKQAGLILADKPAQWTSFDVVNRLRYLIKAKIGHCGTLDPLATGLLILCTGKNTKRITEYQKMPKEYTGIIRLGATTPTYDLESEPENIRPTEGITEEQVRAATLPFTGDIMQVPPIHSAIKKDGKRAYEYARKGEELQLEARPIHISAFEITAFSLPEVHFRVTCSTGTYIRSLAHDFGQALGCGAHLQALRRTKIGDFNVEDAPTVEEWTAFLKEEKAKAAAGNNEV